MLSTWVRRSWLTPPRRNTPTQITTPQILVDLCQDKSLSRPLGYLWKLLLITHSKLLGSHDAFDAKDPEHFSVCLRTIGEHDRLRVSPLYLVDFPCIGCRLFDVFPLFSERSGNVDKH